jgi:hypothetical protein
LTQIFRSQGLINYGESEALDFFPALDTPDGLASSPPFPAAALGRVSATPSIAILSFSASMMRRASGQHLSA